MAISMVTSNWLSRMVSSPGVFETRLALPLAAVSLLLAACGGGGSSEHSNSDTGLTSDAFAGAWNVTAGKLNMQCPSDGVLLEILQGPLPSSYKTTVTGKETFDLVGDLILKMKVDSTSQASQVAPQNLTMMQMDYTFKNVELTINEDGTMALAGGGKVTDRETCDFWYAGVVLTPVGGPKCPAGEHDDGSGKCVSQGCASAYRDDGTGKCALSCASGFHDDGARKCIAAGESCAAGFHEDAAGDCRMTFTAVAAGLSHTCGIKEDGTVKCWGDSSGDLLTPPTDAFSMIAAGICFESRIEGSAGQPGSPACRISSRYIW